MFEKIAHPIVRQSLEGYNGTIFAYGQTSSGEYETNLLALNRNMYRFVRLLECWLTSSINLDCLVGVEFQTKFLFSGKTHTMLGNNTDPGITVLAVRQLFEENESDRTFMIR